jgi:hypothetical protein
MEPGSANARDRELSEGAHLLGDLSSNCDACGASGRRGLCVDPCDPHGAALDEACAECSGSGRWWFPAIRRLGAFTAHLTDAQLRHQLWSGIATGAAPGNQG